MCFKSIRKKIIILKLNNYKDSIHRIVNQHFLECMLALCVQFTRERLNKDFV